MTSAPIENFEARLLALERIVTTLEGGNVPLAEALDAYQRGALLVRECQTALTAAEQRIQVIELDTLREQQAVGSMQPEEGQRK